MRGPPHRPGVRRLWLAILLGALALGLLVPMAFGAGLVLHSACGLTPLGTEGLWTPAVVVNSPPNGTARGWGNGTTAGGAWASPLISNGSAGVLEAYMNWTVYRTGMSWTLGPGLRDACARPYWATAAPGVTPTGSITSLWCPLQGPGNASDIGLSAPTPVPVCPFLGYAEAAVFNDSFVTNCTGGSAYLGGCDSHSIENGGLISVTERATVTGFAVEIPLPQRNWVPALWVGDPVNQSVTYSMTIPGCWISEPVGAPPGLTHGLLAWGPYSRLHSPLVAGSACVFG